MSDEPRPIIKLNDEQWELLMDALQAMRADATEILLDAQDEQRKMLDAIFENFLDIVGERVALIMIAEDFKKTDDGE